MLSGFLHLTVFAELMAITDEDRGKWPGQLEGNIVNDQVSFERKQYSESASEEPDQSGQLGCEALTCYFEWSCKNYELCCLFFLFQWFIFLIFW
jgi:hypothetical protein